MSNLATESHEPLTEEELDGWAATLNDELTRENVERFLTELSVETHPDYYMQLKTLFRVDTTNRRQRIVEEIFSDDRLQIETERSVQDIRFSCLYFLVSFHRRKNNLGQFELWLERGRDEFGERLLYKYQEAILCREQNKYPQAIDKCRPIIEKLPDNYPLVHGFAHNIVHGIEQGFVDEADRRELAAEAIERLEPVLKIVPENGKVHSTLARALAINGLFDEAIQELEKAIEYEDSDQSDYAERVSNYHFHKIRIQLDDYQQSIRKDVEAARSEVDSTVEKAEERVDNLQARLIEFMGFFAGLLAIVFTSTEIALSLSPDAAAQIILVMTSGLICAFASLGILLPRKGDDQRIEAVLAMGVVGLFVGIYVLPRMT